MGVLPRTISEKLTFFETHLPVWAANPESIGLTALQIADLSSLTSEARSAFDAARTARAASRAATGTQNDAVDAMANLGGDFIKTIRAFAETTNDPGVYSAAQIPPPAPPVPLGPPQTPKNVVATLNTAGEIDLSWSGTRAGGTSYAIERSVDSTGGPWTLIGTSEERRFTDQSVPSGVNSISYRVIASRSGGTAAPTMPVTLLFGNTSSGEETNHDGLSLAA